MRAEAEGAEGAARRRQASNGRRSAPRSPSCSKEFAPATPLGKRRTEIGAPPAAVQVPVEALVEREPVTVLCSAKGLDPRGQGPQPRARRHQVQGGRRAALRGRGRDHRQAAGVRHRRPLLHARRRQAAGRARPWRAAAPDDRSRQRARRGGDAALSSPAPKLLVAASDGRGFVVPADEVLAQTRERQAGDDAGRGRAGARLRPRRGRHASRWSATTASCCSSRSPRCRRWRAAAASSCSATTTAGLPTPRSSRSPRA